MEWKAIKLNVQPVEGESWYVQGPNGELVHCGGGDDACKERAQRVSRLLNLGQASELSRDRAYFDGLKVQLETISRLGEELNLALMDGFYGIKEGNRLYPVLLAVQAMKNAAVALQQKVMMGPEHYRASEKETAA